MDRLKLCQVLNRWNPWWIGRIPKFPEFKRAEFFSLKDQCKNNKIAVVTGPRQTGKTTLMYQLILELVSQDIKPQRILYLLLDDLMDELQNGTLSLREILEVWTEDILAEGLFENQKYVFFDEIQLYKKWSREIKILEQQKYPIKFFISGSSSVDILKDTSESLAGRILRTVIMPLKFVEVLKFYLNSEQSQRLDDLSKSFTRSLKEAVYSNEPPLFFEQAKKVNTAIMPIEDKIRIQMNNYSQKGGYPEIALTELDQIQSFARLRNYIDSVIHKDFVNFFKLRDTKTVGRILKMVSKNTSQIISERGLANDLGVAVNTVRNHIGFLKATFLIMGANLFSKSMSKRIRNPEKLYIIDIGLGNALVGYDDNDRGKITETIVHNQLEFLAICNSLYRFELSYWRNRYEVDVVLNVQDRCLPIEVKYAKSKVTEGLKSFMSKHKTWGLIISNELKRDKNVVSIPLHLFLLMN